MATVTVKSICAIISGKQSAVCSEIYPVPGDLFPISAQPPDGVITAAI
jgi:hypothetical protein